MNLESPIFFFSYSVVYFPNRSTTKAEKKKPKAYFLPSPFSLLLCPFSFHTPAPRRGSPRRPVTQTRSGRLSLPSFSPSTERQASPQCPPVKAKFPAAPPPSRLQRHVPQNSQKQI